jgi:hypothetical protein
MKSDPRMELAAMLALAASADVPQFIDTRDYGTAGRSPRSKHASGQCCKCDAAIGPGRAGRMCKTCRSKQPTQNPKGPVTND